MAWFKSQFFAQSPVYRLLIIAFLFITAFGIRLYHINEPPLDFHPNRQYDSALTARWLYFKAEKSIPEWRKQVVNISVQRIGDLEPRVNEHISSYAYRVIGGERFWIPRLLSIIYWLIGGVFLHLIAKRISSNGAALFSTAFYLFLPFGIQASRSLQPDSMMVMMLLFSIFLILRYYDQPSILKLVIAAVVSALAMLIKPMCIFLIFGVFVSLAVYRQGIRKSVIGPGLLIFAVISLLPAIAYYFFYTIYSGSSPVQGQAQYSIDPNLLLSPSFWRDWLIMIGRVTGYIPFLGAIIGFFMFKHKFSKILLAGLWIGYIVFGSVFTYHIHTHDYYQLQFIPVVALSMGPLGAGVMSRLFTRQGTVIMVILLLAVVLSVGFNMRQVQWRDISPDVKKRLEILGSIIGVNPQFIKFIKPDFEKELRIAKEIGEIVSHSTRAVVLSSDNGRSLSYNGDLSALPCSSDIANLIQLKEGEEIPDLEGYAEIYQMIKEFPPEYFIVTDLNELEKQSDLKEFLIKNYPIIAQDDDYLIFDLREVK